MRFLFRREPRGLVVVIEAVEEDLKGRGGWGIGWPKSRASRFTTGVGVDVPDAVGDCCAMNERCVYVNCRHINTNRRSI